MRNRMCGNAAATATTSLSAFARSRLSRVCVQFRVFVAACAGIFFHFDSYSLPLRVFRTPRYEWRNMQKRRVAMCEANRAKEKNNNLNAHIDSAVAVLRRMQK